MTGHSYTLYGPLANSATTLMFEGLPSWADASRIWQVVDCYAVNAIFTAPTSLRVLMKDGDDFVTAIDRSSQRILGTVGEPINPEAWRRYYPVL